MHRKLMKLHIPQFCDLKYAPQPRPPSTSDYFREAPDSGCGPGFKDPEIKAPLSRRIKLLNRYFFSHHRSSVFVGCSSV
jgi:hypothetical protein